MAKLKIIEVTCSRCEGTGVILFTDPDDEYGYNCGQMTCRNCDGTGKETLLYKGRKDATKP